MYLIGLCGKSGSGKSSVCRIFSERGVYCIDADEVCRQVYAEDSCCVWELCERFGSDVAPGGTVDRALLSRRAFAEGQGLACLNAVTHKYIVARLLAQVREAFAAGRRYVVADAPALFESGLNAYCSAVIAVFADEKTLYSRLRLRENITEAEVRERLAAQKSSVFLLKNCDAAIYNSGTPGELRKRALRAMLLVQMKLGVVRAEKEKRRYAVKKPT